MATFAKDTHATASAAALVGGTTTFIEMVCPSRGEDALAGYHTWKQKAEGQTACDYAFHMAVSRWDAATAAQLREIVRDGTASFKVFLAYKNFFGVSDEELFHTLKLAAELGVITTAHCENAELVSQLQQQLLAAGKTGPEWHEPSRPEAVEAEGTCRFATFLGQTGAAGYVVHLSCGPALRAATEARLARRPPVCRIGAAALSAGQDSCRAAGRGRHEARHVAAFARRAQSAGAVGRAESGPDRHRGHGPLPVRHGPKDDRRRATSPRFPTGFPESKTA